MLKIAQKKKVDSKEGPVNEELSVVPAFGRTYVRTELDKNASKTTGTDPRDLEGRKKREKGQTAGRKEEKNEDR